MTTIYKAFIEDRLVQISSTSPKQCISVETDGFQRLQECLKSGHQICRFWLSATVFIEFTMLSMFYPWLQTHKATLWHAILFTNLSINELCACLVCLVRKTSTA